MFQVGDRVRHLYHDSRCGVVVGHGLGMYRVVWADGMVLNHEPEFIALWSEK